MPFPIAQFYLQGFCNPYRFDRNRNGGGIMLYIREDIHSRLIKKKFRTNTEYCMFLASLAKWSSVRLRTKWLWVRAQLQSLNTEYFLDEIN